MHSIGDRIQNILTKEEGQVVGILPTSQLPLRGLGSNTNDELAYVVAVLASRSGPARESLWFHSNVRRAKDGKPGTTMDAG